MRRLRGVPLSAQPKWISSAAARCGSESGQSVCSLHAAREEEGLLPRRCAVHGARRQSHRAGDVLGSASLGPCPCEGADAGVQPHLSEGRARVASNSRSSTASRRKDCAESTAATRPFMTPSHGPDATHFRASHAPPYACSPSAARQTRAAAKQSKQARTPAMATLNIDI